MPTAVDDAEVVYLLIKTVRELIEMLREERKKHRRSRKTKRSHHKKRAKSVFLLGEEIIA